MEDRIRGGLRKLRKWKKSGNQGWSSFFRSRAGAHRLLEYMPEISLYS
jgi:hypothetical protein